ncbi:hypothetical protein FNB15_16175 [Ferrovibrio terrae]|uniref:Uncharacterized protein n=1 Tax=Ferrovibrio terrae TaxID=2594003 RepID=A0A516H4M0_9PROT|nr:hypothetical protein [Ferrovibrio terrae]QDO98718.1 hypothetical protein FNB15_16175 [Ferrovibrio terrae]
MRRLAVLLAVLVAGSAVAAELPREQIVLRSAVSVDAEANTVTLPLFRGEVSGKTVWYIVTDSSDAADALARGVVHAPLLARAGHVQAATRKGGLLHFAAAPDFAPRRGLTPGPQGFPPAEAVPGATAPAAYSPFIRLSSDGPVLNAPIVATGEGPFDLAGHTDVMDRVLAIDTGRGTVTLLLSHGFAEGRRVVYISTEASDSAAAALERATWVPRLGEGEADIALLVFMSAPDQGMAQALLRGGLAREATLGAARELGAPLNILSAFPMGKTARGYSPSWRVTLLQWAEGASPRRLEGQAEIWRLISGKQILGPGGVPPAPGDMVVNCPVIAWLDGPVP